MRCPMCRSETDFVLAFNTNDEPIAWKCTIPVCQTVFQLIDNEIRIVLPDGDLI